MPRSVLREQLQAMAPFLLAVCLALTATAAPRFHTWQESKAPGKTLEISAQLDRAGSAMADGTRKRSSDGSNDLPKDLAVRHVPRGAGENTSPALHPCSDNLPQPPLFGATPTRAPPSRLQI